MKKIAIMLLVLCTLVFSGCTNINKAQKQFDNGNYEKVVDMLENSTDEKAKALYDLASIKVLDTKIDESIKNRNAIQLTENIKSFIAIYGGGNIVEDEKTNLIQKIDELLNGSTSYDDFKMIDTVCNELEKSEKNNDIVTSLKKTASKYEVDKLKAALTGTWTRRDNTGLNGSKIDVVFSENSGKAILKYAAPNSYGFVNGDIKWKDIELYNSNNFSFNDLSKSVYSASYKPANATIDYDTMTISIHISDAYADGTDQSWIKDSYINVTPNNQVASGDFLFPSDTQYITEDVLRQYDKDRVALIRNEIYARHGYIFQSEPFKSYFSSKSWYVPNENFNDSMFNAIEKANNDFIVAYEESQGWR